MANLTLKEKFIQALKLEQEKHAEEWKKKKDIATELTKRYIEDHLQEIAYALFRHEKYELKEPRPEAGWDHEVIRDLGYFLLGNRYIGDQKHYQEAIRDAEQEF